MKYIVKNVEPQAFTDWKALANEDWKPSYDKLSGVEKQVVKTALMQEQGYLCCYCERRLTDEDSHIEHFRPQHDSLVDPLDFSNLLCSCQNKLRTGEPRHCGNLKGDWFDDRWLISPLNSGCEQRFIYYGSGTIHPANAEDEAARLTIERLGLGIAKLNDLRKKAVEPFLDESLTDGDFRTFVAAYLRRDNENRFGEFWTTIHSLFESDQI